MKLQIFKDRSGETRWRLKSRNGKIIGSSGEGFKRKAGAIKGAHAVIGEILAQIHGGDTYSSTVVEAAFPAEEVELAPAELDALK